MGVCSESAAGGECSGERRAAVEQRVKGSKGLKGSGSKGAKGQRAAGQREQRVKGSKGSKGPTLFCSARLATSASPSAPAQSTSAASCCTNSPSSSILLQYGYSKEMIGYLGAIFFVAVFLGSVLFGYVVGTQ